MSPTISVQTLTLKVTSPTFADSMVIIWCSEATVVVVEHILTRKTLLLTEYYEDRAHPQRGDVAIR
jgi:hypothetical protein